MKRFVHYIFCTAILAYLTLVTVPAYAHNQTNALPKPEIYVVMFRADWCGPCKIVEPNLKHALATLRDPEIEQIVIDITNSLLSERSAHAAFDHNIVAQYNKWMGVTGFAAIIDADTKATLGCVNMLYDVGAMTAHIRNLKTYAVVNRSTFDITCPAANPPVQ
ncbi:MAG: hypothetical protein COA69_13135 [Robiginitomaculum sp.]|nr:MAG: hypothetical protein COA69_13135 [Robiginitomaculum sp.]